MPFAIVAAVAAGALAAWIVDVFLVLEMLFDELWTRTLGDAVAAFIGGVPAGILIAHRGWRPVLGATAALVGVTLGFIGRFAADALSADGGQMAIAVDAPLSALAAIGCGALAATAVGRMRWSATA